MRAPKHLKPKTRQWWVKVARENKFTDTQCHLLTLAGEALERSVQAREAVEEHGLIYLDRFGQPRIRPEVAIEKEVKLLYSQFVRELQAGDKLPDWASRLTVAKRQVHHNIIPNSVLNPGVASGARDVVTRFRVLSKIKAHA